MWNFEIDKVVETVKNQMKMFNCEFDEAWNKYMHPIITEQFTLEQVKEYYLKNK